MMTYQKENHRKEGLKLIFDKHFAERFETVCYAEKAVM